MIKGDADALLALYEHNYNDLLSYGTQLAGNLHIAKDAVNDVFLHLWERHLQLKPVKNVRAYLFACIRRSVFHAKEGPHRLLLVEPALYAATETSYEEILIAIQQSNELRKKVRAALSKLTSRQQELIELRFFQNMDYRAIEQATGISVKTAYNTVYNAIRQLAADLRDVLPTLLASLFLLR